MRALKNNTPFIKYKTHRINLRSSFATCSEEERQANKCPRLLTSLLERPGASVPPWDHGGAMPRCRQQTVPHSAQQHGPGAHSCIQGQALR